MPNYTIRPATIADAHFIARGFHMAMLYEDVPEERIRAFAEHICRREDVLYSWRNTLIAEQDGVVVGMITAYDGRYYRAWREQTFRLCEELFGATFPGMEDEAVAGEYYIDSLAVLPEYRGRGIGRALLEQGISRGSAVGLTVTITVDPVNKRAQRLYASLGFRPDGELFIFGHNYYKLAIKNKTDIPSCPCSSHESRRRQERESLAN